MSTAMRTHAPRRRLRVLVVDDHEAVLWGYRALLGPLPWVERCLAARDGAAALALSARYHPHVALVDVVVGGEDGLELSALLTARSASLRVLLISGAEPVTARAARAAGACGVIGKDLPVERIVAALRHAARGGEAFDGWFAPLPLTSRELDVLRRIAAGASNAEIAAELVLADSTVRDQARSAVRKLGARNRADAVRRAHALRLLASPRR